ncbi:MAG: BLUF domain-containing protein [Blastocatellia bacterium]
MEEQLIFLVYVSSATELFSEEALLALLVQAREANLRRSITGMLLYHAGNFMQVIEGPENAVQELHKKIMADPRHTNILTLLCRPQQQRQFAEWSMGFKNLDQEVAANTPGYSDFLQAFLTPREGQEKAERAHKLLLSFRQNLR